MERAPAFAAGESHGKVPSSRTTQKKAKSWVIPQVSKSWVIPLVRRPPEAAAKQARSNHLVLRNARKNPPLHRSLLSFPIGNTWASGSLRCGESRHFGKRSSPPKFFADIPGTDLVGGTGETERNVNPRGPGGLPGAGQFGRAEIEIEPGGSLFLCTLLGLAVLKVWCLTIGGRGCSGICPVRTGIGRTHRRSSCLKSSCPLPMLLLLVP